MCADRAWIIAACPYIILCIYIGWCPQWRHQKMNLVGVVFIVFAAVLPITKCSIFITAMLLIRYNFTFITSIWSFLSCFACSLAFFSSSSNLISSIICKIKVNKYWNSVKDAVMFCRFEQQQQNINMCNLRQWKYLRDYQPFLADAPHTSAASYSWPTSGKSKEFHYCGATRGARNLFFVSGTLKVKEWVKGKVMRQSLLHSIRKHT